MKNMMVLGLQGFLQTELNSVMGNFFPPEHGELNTINGAISSADSGSSTRVGSGQTAKAFSLKMSFLR